MTVRPFQSSDDRDELAWKVRDLTRARHTLAAAPEDPAFKPYRMADAAAGLPTMPTPSDLAHAQATLHQVATCLAHLYEQRRRDDDAPLPRHAVNDPDPAEQDDEPPF